MTVSQGSLPERPRPWEGGRLDTLTSFFVGLTWTGVSGAGRWLVCGGPLPLPALIRDTLGYHGAWNELD